MDREAERYRLALQHPFTVKLAPEVTERPPKIPSDGKVLKIVWWSLKMRVWAKRFDTFKGPTPNIRIFVVFHDPKNHGVLDHSIGLEKGLLGVANTFSDPKQAEQNNFVIAHEILHTLGATDKYNLETFQPAYPDGYAEPSIAPLLPQRKAEIMGGRIPISMTESHIPEQLSNVVIGGKTAREINWID